MRRHHWPYVLYRRVHWTELSYTDISGGSRWAVFVCRPSAPNALIMLLLMTGWGTHQGWPSWGRVALVSEDFPMELVVVWQAWFVLLQPCYEPWLWICWTQATDIYLPAQADVQAWSQLPSYKLLLGQHRTCYPCLAPWGLSSCLLLVVSWHGDVMPPIEQTANHRQ